MEKTTIIILYIISSILISSIEAETLNRTVCLQNGIITKGLINSKTNISQVESAPVKGQCPANKILLEPGVIVNNQFVSSIGYCLDNGFVIYGKATSVGDIIELKEAASSKTCMNSGTILNKGVLLDIVNSNSDKSKVFVVRENQRIANIHYTTRIINETSCLDGKGVILDALVNVYLLAAAKNGSCPTSTLLLESGVIDRGISNKIINSSNECMATGLVVTGRVLASGGSLVPLNGTLLSGGVCQLDVINNSLRAMAGPLLLPGVHLIIPNTETIRRLAAKRSDLHLHGTPKNLVKFGKQPKSKTANLKGVKSPRYSNNKNKKHNLNHISNQHFY